VKDSPSFKRNSPKLQHVTHITTSVPMADYPEGGYGEVSMPSFTQLQQLLEIRVRELENSTKEIRRILNDMNKVIGNTLGLNGGEPSVEEDIPVGVLEYQFKGIPLGMAIRDYLASKRSPATLEEIEERLALGGSDLGKYPKRSVKLAVVNNARYLELRNGIVELKTPIVSELR